MRLHSSRTASFPIEMALVAVGATALLVAGLGTVPPAAAALPPAHLAAATFVDLGTAATYSVLGGTGVANTGAGTGLAGDLGLSPSGLIAGFPPGTYAGTLHDKDAAAATAQADRDAAYADAASQTSTSSFSGDLAGQTFHPGVHSTVAASANTGTITLDADGDSAAVFIFQIPAALSHAAGSKVVLTDGALANNVFWQVGGAVTLAAGAQYVGTFLGAGPITLADGASLKGRVLTPGAVALTNSPVTEPVDDLVAPVVTIDGGDTRSTNDASPPITGTTDEPARRVVTVTVGTQTLTTTVDSGGAWAVGTTRLPEAVHTVVASITDASQNVGTASQVLAVDVTAPVVTIGGGSTRATKATTPTISGTAPGSVGRTVTVAVTGESLSAAIDTDGSWSVDAPALSEAAHGVVASVTDAAQNTGTAHQVLDVDVTVPHVAIVGGATRSTTDTSPWTYGTTAEQAGTSVTVTVGGQSLTTTVGLGGAWGVSAAMLPDGVHEVVASVSDAAQNTGTASQALTVGPVSPALPDPSAPPVPSDTPAPPTPPTPPTPTVLPVPSDKPVPSLPATPEPRYRPDAAIRPLNGAFVGVGSYAGSGQQVTRNLRRPARSATFEVRLSNRGATTEPIAVRGAGTNRTFTVVYLAGNRNVTAAVTAGTYRTGSLAPGKSVLLLVKVTRTKAAGSGARRSLQIQARSAHAPTTQDTVTAVVRMTGR